MKLSRVSLAARLLATLATLAMVATSRPAHAAKEMGLGVTYDPRVPVGSLRDFTPNVSFDGLQAKLDYFPLDALSTGIEVQYQRFQRSIDSETHGIANGAVTASTYRYASFWSFLPTARYYFSDRALRPYVALGAGVSSTKNAILVSDLSQRDVGWAFIVQPSVGVLVRLSEKHPVPLADTGGRSFESMFGLTASLAYAFTTADISGSNNVGFVGIQLGIYAKP